MGNGVNEIESKKIVIYYFEQKEINQEHVDCVCVCMYTNCNLIIFFFCFEWKLEKNETHNR